MPNAARLLSSIHASALSIPFKVAFKHASAERAATQSVWVQCRAADGVIGHGEGCPREYVTAETLQSAQRFITEHAAGWLAEIRDFESLVLWVRDHAEAIDDNPAAWTAVELGILDVMAKREGRPLEAILGLPPLDGRFRYTAVIGDGPARQFEAQLANYVRAGFRDFKIKLSGGAARDGEKARLLAEVGVAPTHVRADANNLWRDADEAIRALKTLQFPFCALEEPLQAGDYKGLERVARELDTRIILDESLARASQLAAAAGLGERCIVNLRVSKMGGLVRSLRLVRAIGERGLGLIVGAHVGETSVLTRAALTVAHAARDRLVAQEGAFGTHLLERDVTETPIMFGPGGVLEISPAMFAARPGLGLDIRHGA
jgi:L-alanine-DL-glutamate epimerase-like enolase superfamily enzyme